MHSRYENKAHAPHPAPEMATVEVTVRGMRVGFTSERSVFMQMADYCRDTFGKGTLRAKSSHHFDYDLEHGDEQDHAAVQDRTASG
jgi:hypothetical protein